MIADESVILLRCFTFHPSHIIHLDTALHLFDTQTNILKAIDMLIL